MVARTRYRGTRARRDGSTPARRALGRRRVVMSEEFVRPIFRDAQRGPSRRGGRAAGRGEPDASCCRTSSQRSALGIEAARSIEVGSRFGEVGAGGGGAFSPQAEKKRRGGGGGKKNRVLRLNVRPNRRRGDHKTPRRRSLAWTRLFLF